MVSSLALPLCYNCIALMNMSAYQLIAFTLSNKHVIELYRLVCTWSRLQQNKACDLLNEILSIALFHHCILQTLQRIQIVLSLGWGHVAHLFITWAKMPLQSNFEEVHCVEHMPSKTFNEQICKLQVILNEQCKEDCSKKTWHLQHKQELAIIAVSLLVLM